MAPADSDPILLTGASGYVGSHAAARAARAAARDVRALVARPGPVALPAGDRRAPRATRSAGDGPRRGARRLPHRLLPDPLDGTGSGDEDFARARPRRPPRNFGAAAARRRRASASSTSAASATTAPRSEHLRSRNEVAELLRRARAAELVHVRAAMVIGAGSASFEILRHLVDRLPVMIAPRWVDTRSQPVAIADVVAGPGRRRRARPMPAARSSSAAPTSSPTVR